MVQISSVLIRETRVYPCPDSKLSGSQIGNQPSWARCAGRRPAPTPLVGEGRPQAEGLWRATLVGTQVVSLLCSSCNEAPFPGEFHAKPAPCCARGNTSRY